MKKTMIGILGLVILAAVGITFFVHAQSDLTTGDYSTAGWSRVYQDQSDYPNRDDRMGYIIRWYDFSKHGGAVGEVVLGPNRTTQRGALISSNTVIMDGYIQVITACTGAGAITGKVSLLTEGDIYTGTGIGSTGFKDLTQTGAAANFLQATNNQDLRFSIEGNAITDGVFMIVLEAAFAQ